MRNNGMTAGERVALARHVERPVAAEYIEAMFSDFFPLAGDRLSGEDSSIIGGPAMFHGIPVTVIANQKGNSLEENIKLRFGMANPQGYRKAIRLMDMAEKFGQPLITFVDTPGAYPGIEAEEMGQGEAIAKSIGKMSQLKVPAITVFIGEGGSGGALALAVSDFTIMLENSIFSILSPEGFASILWKDSGRAEEAAELMKLTASDLQQLGICDKIVWEGREGAHSSRDFIFEKVEEEIQTALAMLLKEKGESIAKNRYKKLRNIGNIKGKVQEVQQWQE